MKARSCANTGFGHADCSWRNVDRSVEPPNRQARSVATGGSGRMLDLNALPFRERQPAGGGLCALSTSAISGGACCAST